MNRSEKLVGRFRSIVGAATSEQLPQEVLFSTLNDIQRKIAEDTLCLETQMNLSIISGSKDYDLSTSNSIVVATDPNGKINGKPEVIVNSTDTAFTWDTPFIDTYVDLSSATVPSYRFEIESAYVSDPTVQEQVVIVSKSLTGIVLRSSSDNTIVRFNVFSVSSASNTAAGTGTTGFYRLKLLELPNSIKLQPIEIDVQTYDLYRRLFFTSTSSSAYVQLYYKIWNNILSFYPTPQSAYTIIVHYYKQPTTDISISVLPEIPSIFDSALLYGAIAELGIAMSKPDLTTGYQVLYDQQITRALNSWRRRKTAPVQIAYNDF